MSIPNRRKSAFLSQNRGCCEIRRGSNDRSEPVETPSHRRRLISSGTNLVLASHQSDTSTGEQPVRSAGSIRRRGRQSCGDHEPVCAACAAAKSRRSMAPLRSTSKHSHPSGTPPSGPVRQRVNDSWSSKLTVPSSLQSVGASSNQKPPLSSKSPPASLIANQEPMRRHLRYLGDRCTWQGRAIGGGSTAIFPMMSIIADTRSWISTVPRVPPSSSRSSRRHSSNGLAH